MTAADGPRRPRRLRGAAGLTLALTLAGCSSGQADQDHPRRALPTIVTTAITADGVSLSPNHLGAGPVKLEITNLTGASQELAVESTGAASFHQETAPINPQDMAQLRARLGPGSYTVSVRAPGLPSASLAVLPTPPAAP